MIIIDFSQVMVSNLFVQMGNHVTGDVDENMLRHMVLNSLRSYKTKYGQEYGELVIAYDSRRGYWRRAVFPYYKASRAKSRENSGLDWGKIFEAFDKIRTELKEVFPYRIIDIEGAEADDVIGTLVKKFGTNNPMNFGNQQKILLISGDKDFIQLHTYTNLKQFSPTLKKYVQHPDPAVYKREHIIRGDSGDGVPNVLSADDCLVVGTRQKPVSSKKLAEWVKHPVPPDFQADERLLRNFKRNQQLIDLDFTPPALAEEIMESYTAQADKKAGNIFNYFMQHRLKHLLESIGDFK